MHIFFQKWIQKLPIPGKGIRHGPRNKPILLFLAQQIVSCSNSAHTRGAVRKPRAMVIVARLTQGGALFFCPPPLISEAQNPESHIILLKSRGGVRVASPVSHMIFLVQRLKELDVLDGGVVMILINHQILN